MKTKELINEIINDNYEGVEWNRKYHILKSEKFEEGNKYDFVRSYGNEKIGFLELNLFDLNSDISFDDQIMKIMALEFSQKEICSQIFDNFSDILNKRVGKNLNWSFKNDLDNDNLEEIYRYLYNTCSAYDEETDTLYQYYALRYRPGLYENLENLYEKRIKPLVERIFNLDKVTKIMDNNDIRRHKMQKSYVYDEFLFTISFDIDENVSIVLGGKTTPKKILECKIDEFEEKIQKIYIDKDADEKLKLTLEKFKNVLNIDLQII